MGRFEDGWTHGTRHERALFCEVRQSRAVFTSRYRLRYAPRIKPLNKGGTTDTRHNYQAHRHHASYWRPLQMYDLLNDPTEQRNLISQTEREALRMSAAEQKEWREALWRLQALLRAHMNATNTTGAAECSASHIA